jgi:ABC-type Fe3+/spermidine/putrescine transport system ATPase subunit
VVSKENGKAVIKNGNGSEFVAAADGVDEVEVGDKVVMTIRPEHVILEQEGTNNNLVGQISTMTYKGNMTRVDIVDVFDCEIHSHAADYNGPAAGKTVRVHLPEDQVIIYRA